MILDIIKIGISRPEYPFACLINIYKTPHIKHVKGLILQNSFFSFFLISINITTFLLRPEALEFILYNSFLLYL